MQKRARCGKMARKGAEKMTAKEFMDFLHILERMKCNTRHGWTSTGRRESVAEHSYRLCAMAFLLRDEFPDLDMGKVLDMCIVHDWGEAVTGVRHGGQHGIVRRLHGEVLQILRGNGVFFHIVLLFFISDRRSVVSAGGEGQDHRRGDQQR